MFCCFPPPHTSCWSVSHLWLWSGGVFLPTNSSSCRCSHGHHSLGFSLYLCLCLCRLSACLRPAVGVCGLSQARSLAEGGGGGVHSRPFCSLRCLGSRRRHHTLLGVVAHWRLPGLSFGIKFVCLAQASPNDKIIEC